MIVCVTLFALLIILGLGNCFQIFESRPSKKDYISGDFYCDTFSWEEVPNGSLLLKIRVISPENFINEDEYEVLTVHSSTRFRNLSDSIGLRCFGTIYNAEYIPEEERNPEELYTHQVAIFDENGNIKRKDDWCIILSSRVLISGTLAPPILIVTDM